jgi:hypothetical protein
VRAKLQYSNVNLKPTKHATYQRLLALKSVMWSWDTVLQVINNSSHQATDAQQYL